VPNPDPNNTGNSFDFPLRFPGQYADRETNLNYNYFRDYDPAIGRYIQSDPIGLEGGINTYGYGDGKPTMLDDPFGLDPVPIYPFPRTSPAPPGVVIEFTLIYPSRVATAIIKRISPQPAYRPPNAASKRAGICG
jgi:RHS repeat-associated protein